ncbi:MAG: hypothetical protein L6R40_003785 [Gallowayella cf. fulva]|nr:MAG: hypothetical protein L6R40_003785 [Xanthomendoza cf. fulva]
MPTYAVLGATGSTGSNVLKLLVQNPKNTINVYVRSKPKLIAQAPNIASNPNVNIFTGNLSDTAIIKSCLQGTDAIFSTVASNDNMPDTHIAQDTAQSIVVALMDIRMSDPKAKLPTIIWLSSASLNEKYHKHGPALLHWLLMHSFSNIYGDLAHAEQYLAMHKNWLNVVIMQPGGLVEDKPHGHKLNLEKPADFLSFADLAAGMIEVAEKGGYDWQGVTLGVKTKGTKFEYSVPAQMAKGLTFHYFPFMWWVTKKLHLQ